MLHFNTVTDACTIHWDWDEYKYVCTQSIYIQFLMFFWSLFGILSCNFSSLSENVSGGRCVSAHTQYTHTHHTCIAWVWEIYRQTLPNAYRELCTHIRVKIYEIWTGIHLNALNKLIWKVLACVCVFASDWHIHFVACVVSFCVIFEHTAHIRALQSICSVQFRCRLKWPANWFDWLKMRPSIYWWFVWLVFLFFFCNSVTFRSLHAGLVAFSTGVATVCSFEWNWRFHLKCIGTRSFTRSSRFVC